MKRSFHKILIDKSTYLGLDLRKIKSLAKCFLLHLKRMAGFRRDLNDFTKQKRLSRTVFEEDLLNPILFDIDDAGGTAVGHYFHQDLLVARKIYDKKPKRHLDVGSRVDGFAAHVAVFREIEILDIRPMISRVENIKFQCVDVSGPLAPEFRECCDSLSCLHALEHFGLGRYGDPIKYDGYEDGFRNLHLMLKKGGTFYFSVPMGPRRIEFNAHRIFSVRFLMKMINPLYLIGSFSYVDKDGHLKSNIDLYDPSVQKDIDNNFGCMFGCAIFELIKL